MLHRHCQIVHPAPAVSGGRGESMGTRRVLAAAVAPNEANSAPASPGRANPQRRDCRVASLLAMTPAGREPVMSNKANWAGRGVGGHGPPYGLVSKASEGRNVKQSQFVAFLA